MTLPFREEDLLADRTPDRRPLEAARQAVAEGVVEIRPDDALGVGPGQRVAGRALRDEELLAGDQVDGLVALDRAPAERDERDACRRPGRPSVLAPLNLSRKG